MPLELKLWLEGQAKANCRSQNAEIVYRLEQVRKQQEVA
ncbi:MAG: Arc domain-containing protein [Pseudomonas sp.]|nr:MAG: Arc domain-containing protein [Pseudomonas sp.]